jgi:hypothetical protein
MPIEDAAAQAAQAAWPLVQAKIKAELPTIGAQVQKVLQDKLATELPPIIDQVRATGMSTLMTRIVPVLQPRVQDSIMKATAPIQSEVKKTLIYGAVALGAVIVGSAIWVRMR